MVTKKCIVCNKDFSTKNKGQKCCSRKCFHINHKKLISGKNCHWYKGKVKKICLICQKEFEIYPYLKNKKKFCSTECEHVWAKTLKGANHQCWKGGKIKSEGYVYIWKNDHPYPNMDNCYVAEHRLVAEKYLERYLTKTEIIHHINEVKGDNRPENLYVFSCRRDHVKFHSNPYPLKSNLI